MKSEPYTRKEVLELGDQFPKRGLFCPRCQTYLPLFVDLPLEEIYELGLVINSLEFIRELRNKTECSAGWAKIWWLHRDGPHVVVDGTPCPYCDNLLHKNAKQCLLCKMNWHDANNPVRRGESIAELILNAEPGTTIKVKNQANWIEALSYVYLKRPDDDLDVVVDDSLSLG
ncbi:hypothetical protein OAK47_00995 [Planctomycetaceae bacterium]|jgi:hypothetical protein|nr:hypothetical protein [Planctomycetaceae bacterium]MDG2389642.1 hypothetical protein [Planctomycetaceae bacterium]